MSEELVKKMYIPRGPTCQDEARELGIRFDTVRCCYYVRPSVQRLHKIEKYKKFTVVALRDNNIDMRIISAYNCIRDTVFDKWTLTVQEYEDNISALNTCGLFKLATIDINYKFHRVYIEPAEDQYKKLMALINTQECDLYVPYEIN